MELSPPTVASYICQQYSVFTAVRPHRGLPAPNPSIAHSVTEPGYEQIKSTQCQLKLTTCSLCPRMMLAVRVMSRHERASRTALHRETQLLYIGTWSLA